MPTSCDPAFNLIDAVSPLLKGASAIIETGLISAEEHALPPEPTEVVVRKGSTEIIVLPSVQLLAWYYHIVADARLVAAGDLPPLITPPEDRLAPPLLAERSPSAAGASASP